MKEKDVRLVCLFILCFQRCLSFLCVYVAEINLCNISENNLKVVDHWVCYLVYKVSHSGEGKPASLKSVHKRSLTRRGPPAG